MNSNEIKAVADMVLKDFEFIRVRLESFSLEYVAAVTEATEADKAWGGTINTAIAAGQIAGKNEAERFGNAILQNHTQFVHKCAAEVKLKEAQAHMEILKLHFRLAEDMGQLVDLLQDLHE